MVYIIFSVIACTYVLLSLACVTVGKTRVGDAADVTSEQVSAPAKTYITAQRQIRFILTCPLIRHAFEDAEHTVIMHSTIQAYFSNYVNCVNMSKRCGV